MTPDDALLLIIIVAFLLAWICDDKEGENSDD